jgi:hypothetical protein
MDGVAGLLVNPWAQHFPCVSSNTPRTVNVDKTIDFVMPAIVVDSMIGVIGDRPKTSHARDVGGERHSVSIDHNLNMCQHMGH